MEKTKVYNIIVLDRSGSMASILHPTISGFNEVLNGIRSAKKEHAETLDQSISLVLFDSSAIQPIYIDKDPDMVPELTDRTYIPGACTPLYDAIGLTINYAKTHIPENQKHSVILTIITDGLENSSSEFSGHQIKKMIEACKEEGWAVSYMGTDHDVYGVSMQLSIDNVHVFEKSSIGMMDTMAYHNRVTENFYSDLEAFERKNPTATMSERRNWQKKRATTYYDKEKPRTK